MPSSDAQQNDPWDTDGTVDESRLLAVSSTDDILPAYQGTQIGRLLEYHNLGLPFEEPSAARLLIGMCMDNRKSLRIPENFAFILRTGGGNLRDNEFKVSFAVAVGRVTAIALIAHTQCGMVDLAGQRESFITGLVENGGWSRSDAEEHFVRLSPQFEIGDALSFVASEAPRLQARYPKILVAPLMYRVEDNRLYQVVTG